MQKRNSIIIAICTVILLITGCKKDLTLIEVMQSGKWKVTAQTYNGKDTFNDMEACEKDNLTTFKSDNTYLVDEGATKCDSKDPQTQEEGGYTVSADEKIVTLKTKGVISFSVDLNVVSYEDEQLQLELVDGTDKLVITFTKQ